MHDFQSGLSARAVHDRLVSALDDLQRAERSAVLWFADVLERKLYRDLGFSSIHDYATEALGFSRTKTYQFLRLAEALGDLPALRKAIGEGEVSWTKAREVVKVATPKSEEAWIAIAGSTGRRELERRVAATRSRAKAARRAPGQTAMAVIDPRAAGPASRLGNDGNPPESVESADAPAEDTPVEIPFDLHWRLTPEQGAQYEALIERIRKLGERAEKTELLLAGLAALAEELEEKRAARVPEPIAVSPDGECTRGDSGPDRSAGGRENRNAPARIHTTSPYQVVVQLCSRCDAGAVVTNRGERSLDPAALRSILCDAVVLDEDGRNRASVPPRLRRMVLARDGYRCRVGGCRRTRFLQVHHVIPREAGGPNELDRLVTACSWCHRALHGPAKEMPCRPALRRQSVGGGAMPPGSIGP